MSFQQDISKFKQSTLKKIERTRKGATFRLFSAVIMDTPVGNVDTWRMSDSQKRAAKKAGYTGGMLRNSWVCTRNLPSSQLGKPGGTAQQALNQTLGTINTSRGDDTLFLVNNQPYAARIELDGWSHTKAPEGMVRRNIVRFHRLFKEALNKS